jgi:N-methylhydantoinase B
LLDNSCGDGTHRGGLGAVYEIELLEESAEAFIFGERGKASPKGIAGGGEALPNVFLYQQDGQWCKPPMVSKMQGIQLLKGQRVRLETPGGGGWGPAAGRDAAARTHDEAQGFVSDSNPTSSKVQP